MKEFTYSIVIPFRDKMDLLQIACKSIPDREDIQILIIDNSKESMEKCYTPVHTVAQVDYLTSSPTKGAGCARNVGVANAKGKWLLFLDSDDYYTKEAFSAFDKYKNSENDIVFFDIRAEFLSTKEPSKRSENYNRNIANKDEDRLRYRTAVPYCKMVRRQLVIDNSLSFQEVPVSNDLMFSLTVGHAAKKCAIDDTVCYCVTEGDKNTSLIKTKSPENEFCRYRIVIQRNHFFENIGRDDLRFRLISRIIYAFRHFGFKEGMKYLKLAHQEHQNIFKGHRF